MPKQNLICSLASNTAEVTYIQELGFRNTLTCGLVKSPKRKATETVYFIDAEGNTSLKATDKAILDAIARWKHHAETLELYLKNGRNNNTHEWK